MAGDVTLGTAVAEIGMDYSKLASGIAASKTLIGGLSTSLLGIGAIGVGLAVATTKMAGDFQEGMTSLVTGAGESQKNLGLVSDGILNLATQTGTSTKDLTAGMYMIESAGYHGAAGLDVLKAAAEGAKVGSASLADVANGVTTAMTDYASSGLTAAQATNALIATVAAGKTHMGDLANSLANILPTSSAAGVGLRDVMGAMATMTGEGIPAAQAATYLRQTILGLVAPSAGTVKALDAVGLKSADVAAEMKKSLPDALAMITDAVGKKFPEGSAEYVNAIKNISGGSKTMQGMLDLTGDHLKTFEGNVATISGTVKSGGDAIQGWALVQEDFNTKMAQAKEVVEVLGIKIGTVLLPVASKLFDLVTPLVSGFDDWITKSGILNQITAELSTATTQLGNAFQVVTTPVTQIKTVMAPLLDDIDRASGYFKPLAQSVNTMSDAFDRGMGAVAPFVPGLNTMSDAVDRGNGALASVVTTVNPFVDIFQQLKPVVSDVVSIFQEAGSIIPPLVKDVENFTTGIAAAAWNSGAFQSVIHAVKDILPDVGTFLQNVGTDINTNLLPPLESLVTNVGGVISNFATWADKSGAAKTALNDVEGVIKTTTQVLGPLINAVATTVGWLGGGGAGTDTLVVALSAVATAFVMLKIANTVSQFSQLWTKLSEGEGLVANLAVSVKDKLGGAFDSFLSKQAPAFKKSLDDMKAKGDSAGTSVEEMGTKTQVAGAKVATAGTEAETASGEIKQLSLWEDEAGTKAETMGTETQVAGTKVATMGTEAEVSGTEVKTLGADAATAGGEVTAMGVEAEVSGKEVMTMGGEAGMAAGEVGAVGEVAVTATAEVGSLGSMAANAFSWLGKLTSSMGFLGGMLNLTNIHVIPDGGTINGQHVNFIQNARGGKNIPAGLSLVGEEGPEIIDVPGGSDIYPHGQMPSYAPSGGGSSVPYTSSNAGGGGHSGPVHIYVMLDAKQIGHATAPHIVQEMRVRTAVRN